VLWFKAGKGKDGSPQDKEAFPKGVVNLEQVNDANQISITTGDPTTFKILSSGEIFAFQADTTDIASEWMKILKSTVEQLKQNGKRESEEWNKKMKEVQNIFPENFRVPSSVLPEQGEKWYGDQKRFRDEFAKWSPFMFGLGCYAEYTTGRTKGYHTWFTNKSKGVLSLLNNGEEMVLSSWELIVKNLNGKMLEATETMFYMDDLKSCLKDSEDAIKAVEVYRIYKKDIHKDDNSYFEEELQQAQNWLIKLKSYPLTKDVSLSEYSSGAISCSNETWVYNSEDLTLTQQSEDNIQFTGQGHPFLFTNPVFGNILWNNRSWVWTHPRCPYLIRYDWYAAKQVFKQYCKKDPPQTGKKVIATAPALSDWQVQGVTFNAVSVGHRDPPPEVPAIVSWELGNESMPPPVILLAVMFNRISPIVRSILGIGTNLPSGLEPIF